MAERLGKFDFGSPEDPLWVGRDSRNRPVLTSAFKAYVDGRFQELTKFSKEIYERREGGLDTSALSEKLDLVTEQLIEAFTPK